MSMTASVIQRQRQRRFHRRSRNGCSTCKAKHIRCDEKKPLCTYCLRHGGECGYPVDSDESSTCTETGGRSVSRSVEPTGPEPNSNPLDFTLNDPFLGTSFDMPHKSRSLFQLCEFIHRALSHPGFLHAALLMTSLHWAWCIGDVEQFRVPYLYHKLQAIRFVNEQLKNPETAVNESTVAAVASLAVVENALGSVDAVSSHLRGLARIKELQGRDRLPEKMGLLQRMILMAARSVSSRPVWDIHDISRTDDVHQSMIISILSVALRPIYSMLVLSGSEDSDEPLSEVMAKRAPHAHTHDHDVLSPIRQVDCSRSGFIACYFYLYVILRESTVDSFILNWFVEQLLVDVCRTEAPMQRGQYSQSLWFWTVMFGACVTTAARTNSEMEKRQMKVLRDIYLDKISLVTQLLRIKTWEGAKSVLRLFAWEDDFDGELELRALWEEAVWENEEERPRSKPADYLEFQSHLAQACC
ncbi:hypothetical protein F4775DRAFT_581443 [Biscogniauxia sp. FL1348]|nr:hypothetical protein F4775DRAFT_581443 [Biscogniauxia sp. FL1348]